MKSTSKRRLAMAALLAWAWTGASGELRMQVRPAGAVIRSRPGLDAPAVDQSAAGEIVFVDRLEGEWAAISPPDRVSLWINREFVGGNRVVGRGIQIRSGPGLHHDVVGTLDRGALVMPRGEEGEWLSIAPPSSATLWVKTSDLAEMRPRGEMPFDPIASAPSPSPAPATAAPPPPPSPPATASATPPARRPDPVAPSAPAGAPSPAPSAPPPAPRPASAPVAAPPAPPPQRPATPIVAAIPAPPQPAAPRQPLPDADVDPALVRQLKLVQTPNQGAPVQLVGELRAAPFASASPSRYRLISTGGRTVETLCHVHGHSPDLRGFVGKRVVLRGREYWVCRSDLPVVVVGQIYPAAP